MSMEDIIFALSMAGLFIMMILYIVFGQITVRKLRKNPDTKDELGSELASGLDILNVASALALPRWLNRKFRNSLLGGLYANAEILDKYTNWFDRLLARILYGLFVVTGAALITMGILDNFGFLD